VAHLDRMTRLQLLDISGTKVSEAGLARAAKLPALRKLVGRVDRGCDTLNRRPCLY